MDKNSDIDSSQETRPFKINELSSRKKKPKQYLSLDSIFTIIVASVFALSISISFTFLTKNTYLKFYRNNYACVINSASTGSIAYIYKYPKKYRHKLPPFSQVSRSQNFEPAIGEIEIDENIEAEMESILIFCENGIMDDSKDTTNITETPVYFISTIGMRRLPNSDKNKKLTIVRDTIKQTNFKFKDNKAKVISGIEESKYNWITVNYLHNILTINEKKNETYKDTYGVINLNSFSVEISYIPENKNEVDNMLNLNIGNLNYKLFTYSFENYGKDDMYEKLFLYLIQNNQNQENNRINHPCFLKGYEEKFTDKSNNKTYNFIGKGDFNECKNIVKNLIVKKNCPQNSNYCSLEGISLPKMKNGQKFNAISDFVVTSTFLQMDEVNLHSPADLLELTKIFCEKSWEKVNDEKKDWDPDDLKMHCFIGNYIYHLLVYGLGFGENNKNIIFGSRINNVDANFALGEMIYETNNIINAR